MCIRKGGAEHERAKMGVVNRTWYAEDRERERKRRLGQDHGSIKLDMRQTTVESCAFDGEGYAHCERGYRTRVHSQTIVLGQNLSPSLR